MEKISLPTKTKIAACWMKNWGIFLLGIGVAQPLILIASLILFCSGRMNCSIPFELGFAFRLITLLMPTPVFMFDIASYLPQTETPSWKDYFSPYWEDYFEPVIAYLVFGIFLVISSHFLFKKKKWAFMFSVSLISLMWLFPFLLSGIFILLPPENEYGPRVVTVTDVMFLIHLLFFGPLIYLTPLTLLIFDRKNFWKIAT